MLAYATLSPNAGLIIAGTVLVSARCAEGGHFETGLSVRRARGEQRARRRELPAMRSTQMAPALCRSIPVVGYSPAPSAGCALGG
jgi:hypothetical protein